ncbi:unnamed protein product [Choristocarpus tenellus]
MVSTEDDSHLRDTNPPYAKPILSPFRPKNEYLFHFDMLKDKRRNQAYKEAIRRCTSSGENGRWLDIGTGSGLLASMVVTAEPSAAVWAFEVVEELADVAQETFRGCNSKVQLIRHHSTQVNVGKVMPCRATHVVAELLDTGLLGEGLMSSMHHAKAHLLEPEFVSIPAAAEVWAFACESPELDCMGRIQVGGYGSAPEIIMPSSLAWKKCRGAASAESMHISFPQRGAVSFRPLTGNELLWEFDFTDLPPPSGRRQSIRISVHSDGTVNAIILWWRCYMDKSRSIIMTTEPGETADPPSDHWRQAVFLLPQPVLVLEGDILQGTAAHDTDMMWFEGVVAKRPANQPVDCDGSMEEGNSPKRTRVQSPTAGVRGRSKSPNPPEDFKAMPEEGSCDRADRFDCIEGPPICSCGLHVTADRNRIWMINDRARTTAYRAALRQLNVSTGRSPPIPEQVAQSGNDGVGPVYLCISEGFLLPLLSVQEGAACVLEFPQSPLARRVANAVYTANGVADRVKDVSSQRLSSFYDLISQEPGSLALLSTLGKFDAIIGEPYFSDIAQHCWPMEALMLFWCARSALEASGCFMPQTKVMPACARLLACPIECPFLHHAHSPVGDVEGVDMSAVNDLLGVRVNHEWDPSDSGMPLPSFRLWEYPHRLLSAPITLLEMDMTKPLYNLSGHAEILFAGAVAGAECHGLALWLELWLDEAGEHRVLMGPKDAPYWCQGFVFFKEAWVVPDGGRGFVMTAFIEDGALRLKVS